MQPTVGRLLICNLIFTACYFATCCPFQRRVQGYVSYNIHIRGASPPYKYIVKYISLYSSLEWTAGCKITGCEKQVAYQQPAHSRLHIRNRPTRLPNWQDDVIMNLNLRKFNDEMPSTLCRRPRDSRLPACEPGSGERAQCEASTQLNCIDPD